MKELKIQNYCPSCKAKIGENHEHGCSIERCPFCGKQMITDSCCYEYFGISVDTMEEEHPDIYENGLTEKMTEVYEEYIRPYLMAWDGTWPGDRECHEYGFWCKMGNNGWKSCEVDDPEATEDLNRLYMSTVWDKEKKRRVMKSTISSKGNANAE